MCVVSYLAKRSFTGGAVLDDAIVKNVNLADLSEGRDVSRSEQTALGGAREYIYDRAEQTWFCTLRPVQIGSTDELEVRMFLDSIESGQVFSFAPYSESTDSPIDYRDVMVSSSGWNAARVLKKGGATRGASDYIQFSFSVVETP